MGIVNNMEFYCDINTIHYERSLDFFLLQWTFSAKTILSINIQYQMQTLPNQIKRILISQCPSLYDISKY
jgi:hypothetical protein